MRLLIMLGVISAGLLSGCDRISAEKGISSCRFEATKASGETERINLITSACMESKGYVRMEGDYCQNGYASAIPGCWRKTWRIILP